MINKIEIGSMWKTISLDCLDFRLDRRGMFLVIDKIEYSSVNSEAFHDNITRLLVIWSGEETVKRFTFFDDFFHRSWILVE